MSFFDSSEKPLIYLITRGDATPENFTEKSVRILQIIAAAVQTKIPLVQIREKRLTAKLLFELARRAAPITENSATKLLINDRADIALAAGASGVHLTENSLSAKIVRQNFPANFIIGVSAHSFETLSAAKAENADFAVFSPVFASPGKSAPVGLDGLRAACEKLRPFPVVALGGVDETNYEKVLETARGFAAIRFLNDAENLRKLSEKLNL